MRLTTGKLVIHSMAPFTAQDLAGIQAVGEPGWLVEAMLLHDTYAAKGKEHYPTLPFLGPPGFSAVVTAVTSTRRADSQTSCTRAPRIQNRVR